jgi:hypothetical protein
VRIVPGDVPVVKRAVLFFACLAVIGFHPEAIVSVSAQHEIRRDTLEMISIADATQPVMLGDRVVFELTNARAETVKANLCFLNISLNRYRSGEWTVVDAMLGPDLAPCFDHLPHIRSGQKMQDEIVLLSDVPPGRYRLSVNGYLGEARAVFVSGPFEVNRK